MNKLVLCVGDSLGMPRSDVSFFDTWYYKLSSTKNEYYFVNNFRRALTTNELISPDFLENYRPSIVILQVGIVDCAPRIFKKDSLIPKIVNRLPAFIKNLFWITLKRYKKRTPKNSDVSLEDFSLNLNNYLKRCELCMVEKVIIIKIQKPGSNMVRKNKNIYKSIQSYNYIIDSLEFKGDLCVIDPLGDAVDSDYISDGYHLNSNGFDKVFNKLTLVL